MDRSPLEQQSPAFAGNVAGGLKPRLAWLALAWEAAWPALWPGIGVAGLFLGLALLDILPALGFALHLAALVLFLGVFLFLTMRNLRQLRLPEARAALRRLETASGLSHRPLSGLQDTLGSNPKDPMAQALWQAHQARLRGIVRSLRVGLPSPGLARCDVWGLRAALGLLLVVAVAAGWRDADDRLLRAVTPSFAGAVPAGPPTVDAWINPPAYTGLPPLYLRKAAADAATPSAQPDEAAPLSIPTGSTLLVQVHGGGGDGPPVLRLDAAETAFQSIDASNHRLETELTGGTRLGIVQDGAILQEWRIRVLPDQAPSVAFHSDPAAGERDALKLDYEASDDYGLEGVTATIRRVVSTEPGAAVIGEETIELALILPALAPKQAHAASYHDLTPHPWAGTPVRIELTARDAIGQEGHSAPFALLLPERQFSHPVARAIIEQRKRLTLEPEAREDIAEQLTGIAAQPQAYNDDMVVFLALKSSVTRLGESAAGIVAVQDLLWDTALRLEDGGVSLAERDLRDIQRRLQEALARNAPEQELERLMDELERAMDRFMEAMMERMEQMAEQGMQPDQFDPSQMQRIDRQDLQRMMDQMREMMRSGARDKVQQMLSQMQQMMENLRFGMMQQQNSQQMQQQMQSLQELQDLTRRQQQLLDETFRMQQQMQGDADQPSQRGQQPGLQGQQGPQQGAQNRQMGQEGRSGQAEGRSRMTPERGAALQEALRRALGDLMRRMGEAGEIPRQLGQAERAMRDSGDALRGNQPGEAIPAETEALDQLRSGAQQMAEQLAQQMMAGQQSGQQGQDRPGQQGHRQGERDPFGRPYNNDGNFATGDVQVPEESDLKRAREIFDELRRRSGDTDRPNYELDYIDRLLRRF
jgi:uncharacterized protein (TIGR02302 family)